jgi:predicted dehydrogenase
MRVCALVLLPALLGAAGAPELRLVTLDPAHFHAAQFYSGALPGFSRDAWVYAPVGPDLAGYLTSVSQLSERSPKPDHWRFHVYAGSDYLDRMLSEKPGNVLAISGRNQRAIEYIEAGLRAGMHVLADKPWIIAARDFDRLQAVLNEADRRGLIAFDCMSQRFDIAYQLQRELVNDRAIFGELQTGTADQPAVRMASSHFLLKTFNGMVNRRPAWFFDIAQQGEALADVGTHVVDLAHWTLFRNQALDYSKDIRLLTARRWPTVLTLDQFRRVTGEPEFPAFVKSAVHDGKLDYYANNSLLYTARGIYIELQVSWDYESPAGDKDSMLATYRGGLSEVAVRAEREQHFLPEVDVTPLRAVDRIRVKSALEAKLKRLGSAYPGLTVREEGQRLQVVIPPSLRVPDVQYFLLLAEEFAGFIRQPGTLPTWEKPNMLAKYYVTTHGVELARATARK